MQKSSAFQIGYIAAIKQAAELPPVWLPGQPRPKGYSGPHVENSFPGDDMANISQLFRDRFRKNTTGGFNDRTGRDLPRPYAPTTLANTSPWAERHSVLSHPRSVFWVDRLRTHAAGEIPREELYDFIHQTNGQAGLGTGDRSTIDYPAVGQPRLAHSRTIQPLPPPSPTTQRSFYPRTDLPQIPRRY